MIQVAVSIAHHPSPPPERAASLEALLETLRGPWPVHVERSPGKPHEWNTLHWRGALVAGATHALILDDDVQPCPGFVEVLPRALWQRPADIVALLAQAPDAAEIRATGASWYTSADGLIGCAYVMPTPLLEDFLAWRGHALVDGALDWANGGLSSDQLVNLYAMATGRRIWHTLPSLVTLADVESGFGNGPLPYLPPEPDMRAVDWAREGPHTGRFFNGNHRHLLTRLRPEVWRRHRCVERYYELERDRPAPAPA